ncbi:MAG TPA: DUF5654 family protein [Candidatus Nanoarchaeia archaeon]|nr:DUF5654 family protein [Candidatus Nanoarchaeia archaeon]
MVIRRVKENIKQLTEKQTRELLEKVLEIRTSFRSEFKKQTVLAITAAFGFLIALVWRDYLMSIIKAESLTFISVIIITAVCVLGLVIISKWASNDAEQKKFEE